VPPWLSLRPSLPRRFSEIPSSKNLSENSRESREIQGNERKFREPKTDLFPSFPCFSHRSPATPKMALYNSPMNARTLDIRKSACLAKAILRKQVNAKVKCFFPPPGACEASTCDRSRHVRLSSTAAPKTACRIHSMRDRLLKMPMTLVTHIRWRTAYYGLLRVITAYYGLLRPKKANSPKNLRQASGPA
jgi:hypothetical protein